ncbi:valine--pyruvate transaminase [Streptomyces sp. PR69]|uniref:valine--pyruvate transaminase n=1 Tax=Streptomyces sp. PR69 TaxID=2984950 RepID=UPI002263B911|nr:valine--pyruvate transaminase [Streptomyces sp. PR69]
MALSLIGSKMATLSGLRSIMEDIAVSTASGPADWLNLGIGNPAAIPGTIAEWRSLTEEALAEDFASAGCQYGPSRGSAALVEAITGYFNERYGWSLTPHNVAVGPGSQMLCFTAAALFAGPGGSAGAGTTAGTKVVLPMAPDYTGYQGLCLHPDGVAGIPATPVSEDTHRFRYALDFDALERQQDMGMLLLSSPGNPTGRAVDAAELDALIGLARQRDIPLLLDHAYGEPFPRIAPTPTPPPLDEHVVNCFTLSKAGLPGERIAFAVGPARWITPMVSFLANSVLHAPQLQQSVVARALTSGRLDRLVTDTVSPFYQERRRLAEKLFEEVMPESVPWRLHSGDGGMFCWFWIDDDRFDDTALYERLKQDRVFIVPGRHFFPDTYSTSHRTRCFRVSLSPDVDTLTEGITRIARALRR